MKKGDSKLNKILNAHIASNPEDLRVAEHGIPLKTQLLYLDFVLKNAEKINEEKADRLVEKLQMQPDIETTKYILAALSLTTDIKAFRALENFVKKPFEPELDTWSKMALQQSRMLIESDLIDEPRAYISSGLGGKGKKLRFFLIFHSKDLVNFTNLQKQVLQKEISYEAEESKAVVEQIHFADFYAKLLVLLPLTDDITRFIDTILDNANEFGDFLDEEVIISTTKVYENHEIREKLLNGWEDEENDGIMAALDGIIDLLEDQADSFSDDDDDDFDDDDFYDEDDIGDDDTPF